MIGDPVYAWPLVSETVLPILPAEEDVLAVKVTVEGVHRRFALANNMDMIAVVALCRALFHLSSEEILTLSWVDNDGDYCRVEHDVELCEAVREARKNRDILRLQGQVRPSVNGLALRADQRQYAESAIYESESEYDSVSGGAYRAHEDVDTSDSDTDGDESDMRRLYTPLVTDATDAPAERTLIRELEDLEMEENLLPGSYPTNAWSCATQCAPETRQAGAQATYSTFEQSVQVDLLSLARVIHRAQLYAPRPLTNTIGIQAASATVDACAQAAPTSLSTAIQVSPVTTESCTQQESSPAINLNASVQCDLACVTQYEAATIDARCASKGFKTVGFSHAINIPAGTDDHEDISGDEDERQLGSPHLRELDEESVELLEDGEMQTFVII